ncbi:MAG: hypothetical protein Kow0031_21150 [Anaerolineae bacterium]
MTRFHQFALGLWLCGLLLITPAQAQSEPDTTLSLENVPLQDERLLVVNIQLGNITDLYGAEVQLTYDPARLRVRDDNRRLDGIQISPGPLIAGDDRFVVNNQASPNSGDINFAFTLLKPAKPISGEGVLATVVFEIVGDGPYAVDVAHAQLVSVNLEPIAAEISGLELANGNGSLPLDVATPAATTPGLPWAAAVVTLGTLAALGALIYLGAKRRPAPPAPAAEANPTDRRAPRPSAQSTVRSAALLSEQADRALAQDERQRAFELYSRAIELDPANVPAWLGKAQMADQPAEKRLCLQRVLALEPENEAARQAMEELVRNA